MLKLLFPLCFLVFAIGATAFGAPVSVSIKSAAVADSEILRVSDIASLRGGDPARIARIGAVSLGYAPNPGAVREIAKSRVKLAILATGFPASDFSLVGPDTTYVTRKGQSISTIEVDSAIKNAVEGFASAGSFTVSRLVIDSQPITGLPTGKIELRADISAVRNLFEPFFVSLEIRIDGRHQKKVSVRVECEATARVAVLRNPIAPQQRILPEDVAFENVRLERNLSEYVTDQNGLRAIKSARAISPGEPLERSMFVADLAVRNGDRVKIVAENGTLTLAVTGVALSAGRIGDRILVKNVDSGKQLQATVLDEGVVGIRF